MQIVIPQAFEANASSSGGIQTLVEWNFNQDYKTMKSESGFSAILCIKRIFTQTPPMHCNGWFAPFGILSMLILIPDICHLDHL